jgi:hypothetical protein
MTFDGIDVEGKERTGEDDTTMGMITAFREYDMEEIAGLIIKHEQIKSYYIDSKLSTSLSVA